MAYKVSVIIPIYNSERYLRQTIDSVVCQRGFEFEKDIQLILINNATEDNSEQICLEYVNHYPKNVTYLKLESNNGPSRARNVGLSCASADTINFLDSDDCWEENALFKAYETLKNNSAIVDLVVCRVKNFESENGWDLYDWRFKKGSRVIDISEESDARQCKITPCLIKSEVAKEVIFDEEVRHAEDMKYVTDIILKKGKFYLLKEAVFLYRVRDNGSSLWQSIKKSRNWYFETVNNVLEYLIEISIKKYGYVIRYIQFLIYGDLHDRIPLKEIDILTQDEFDEYKSKLEKCFGIVDDSIIVEDTRLPLEMKVYEILFKYECNPRAISVLVNLVNNGLLKEKIRYLFPYEMVSPGDDIYLYGGGDLGRQYLDEIARGNYCNVMGVIDKDIKKCIVVHEHLFYLNEFNFSGIEKIIISIVDAKIAEDVKQD